MLQVPGTTQGGRPGARPRNNSDSETMCSTASSSMTLNAHSIVRTSGRQAVVTDALSGAGRDGAPLDLAKQVVGALRRSFRILWVAALRIIFGEDRGYLAPHLTSPLVAAGCPVGRVVGQVPASEEPSADLDGDAVVLIHIGSVPRVRVRPHHMDMPAAAFIALVVRDEHGGLTGVKSDVGVEELSVRERVGGLEDLDVTSCRAQCTEVSHDGRHLALRQGERILYLARVGH